MRRPSSGEMLALGAGAPSSGEFRVGGSRAESFRPLLELGRGGMARVYLAEKTTRGLRRLVVLKVLEPSLAMDPEMRTLFRREAEVCARLHHPNVVQVFEVIDQAASPFMVMEYVEGVSLSQVLARTEQRLLLRLHLHVLMQVLAGLHYFHELKDEEGNLLHGVHRDVSPQNVVVMHEGVVKVLDFGIAKLREPESGDVTRAGIIKGKLSYMPPEQLIGDATIDRRADVFAVGVMLWEALARRRMWEGVGQQDMMRALVAGNLPSVREACPWVTEALATVVERAIAARREDRYQTALELQVALEQCMAELGGFVQQRELSSFMEAEFGDWRRERQRAVDAELRRPAIGLGEVLEPSVIEDAAVESQSLQHGHVSSRIGPADSERRWVTPSIALVLAALAIGFLFLTRVRERDSQALPPPAPLPTVPAPVHIVVREAPAAAASPVTEPSASPSAGQRAPVPHLRAPRRLAPSAAAAGTTPGAASRSCNPPYVLDSEGVKTYKPECL